MAIYRLAGTFSDIGDCLTGRIAVGTPALSSSTSFEPGDQVCRGETGGVRGGDASAHGSECRGVPRPGGAAGEG